jgi:predicted HicB family RNase H-like nuclease
MDTNNSFTSFPTTQRSSTAEQSADERSKEALRVAGELFRQGPDWVTFFREILGVGGAVRNLFSTQDEHTWFEQTEEYAEIQQMVAQLRTQVVATTSGDDKEPTRVITVRLPKSLHELLRKEAHDRSTSMNKLCISKLLQVIDEELVPNDLGDALAKNQVKIVRVDEPHAQTNQPHESRQQGATPEQSTPAETVNQPHVREEYRSPR